MVRLFNGIIFCAVVYCTCGDSQDINGLNGESTFEPELEIEENAKGVKYYSLNSTTTEDSSIDLASLTIPYNFTSCNSKDVCFGNETTSEVEYRNLRNCMCDERCVRYRDCCKTSVYYKKEEQTYMEPSPYTCLSIPGILFESSLLMRTSCSSSWNDTDISEKCNLATKNRLELNNLNVTTPVTSFSTNITYGNAYCALCNFDNNFQQWNVTVGCSSESVPPEVSDNKTEYIKNYYSQNGTFPPGCSLCLNIRDNTPVDFCERYSKVISSCPADWLNQEMRELCNNFHSLVAVRGVAYRNEYCAYCNGVPYDQIDCSERPHYIPLPNSFTILLDFHELGSVRLQNQSISHNKTLSSYEGSFMFWFLIWWEKVSMLLSIFFLIVYLIVFSCLKELRNFGGKNLASFCVALIFCYGTEMFQSHTENTVCIVLGVLDYYFAFVVFLSMLTTTYNLWRTIWNTTRKLRLSEKENTKFVAYCLCNWLFPVMPLSLVLYLEYFSTPSEYSPRFGKDDFYCWFTNITSGHLFFDYPVYLIILLNAAFFTHAFYMIRKTRCVSANINNRVDFKLYLRLALLSGLTFTIRPVDDYFDNFWILFVDCILNSALGIFIFVAFVCKRKIIVVFLDRIGFAGKLASRLKNASTMRTNSDNNAALNMSNVSSEVSEICTSGIRTE